MTAPLPAPSAAPEFPLDLQLEAPDTIARWRPLVHWLLAIPHVIVLYGLGIVEGVVWILSFFAILFTGELPESFFGIIVMVHRYQWRVASYLFFMREEYPAFEFPTAAADPATDPARLTIERAPELNRWMVLVKWLLAFPHYVILFVLFIAVYVVGIIGFFAVLITGKWPEGMRNFVIGVMRWSNRVSIYIYLLTDIYPPFSLD